MVSIEFQLARETARTTWREPELPWGGIPNLTDQDIQFALGAINHPIGAHLLKAKFADNQRSSRIVADWTVEQSVAKWRADPILKMRQISFYTVERVGELAVLYYMIPKARDRTTEANISYCAASKLAWRNNLSGHHARLWNQLEDISTYAVRCVRGFLHGE